MSSTSGLRCAAMEKPRRAFMPLEYRLTGVSMKRSRSANETISSKCAAISARRMPMIAPCR